MAYTVPLAKTVVRRQTGRLDGSFVAKAGPVSVRLRNPSQPGSADNIPASIGIHRGEPHLRLWLADGFPPGTYAAEMIVGGEAFDVDIEVEAKSRVRISPSTLILSGSAGAKASVTFDIENLGNVPIELPATALFGAFANDGIATAFSSTYEMDSSDPQEMFGNFVLRLRDGYAGLVRMRFEDVKAPLVPGEHRTITLNATLPAKMKKGRHYHFVLEYAGLNTAVQIQSS